MASRLNHLGVNALFLQPRMGGLETYVRRLLPELATLRPNLRISVFVSRAGRDLIAAEPWADAVELVCPPVLARRGARALGETLFLGRVADGRDVDLLHSVALTGPLASRARRVLSVADVTWLLEPEPAERGTIALWRLLVPPAARRAHRVTVLSNAMKPDVSQLLGVPEERIDVIPLGYDEAPRAEPVPEPLLRERLALGKGPIVLAVSASKAHKNVAGLVRAMPAVRASHPEAVVVVPGNPTRRQAELRRLAAELRVADAVVFPGWVDEATLEGLYSAAACFAFPSLHEGFGLPLLEAMARGVPVACSRASSLPEVAGDAALLFEPRDPDDIARAVNAVLSDPALAQQLVARGRERCRSFSWRRTAEETLQSYDKAFHR